MHRPDNGDGTFTNPVMPNGHWSDPAVVRVADRFYCVTSSIETCPLMQILESADLVNWDVIGSVSRTWFPHLPSYQNWSPRISYFDGVFRVYFHVTISGFAIAEAAAPQGPYRLREHSFGDMTEQWAASVFVDDDGRKYLVCSNWIQKLDPAGLAFGGPRSVVTEGFLENPWLIKREGWYYWLCSENGTDVWGVQPDKSKVSVWRSAQVLGPYEKCPRTLIRANLEFQAPNTGSAVLGPDGNWWYLYNTFQVTRLTLCRQLHLDRLDWGADGWPVINRNAGPARGYPKPIPGWSPRWLPDLNDEFDAPTLEGVNGGVLGRKWLFKREEPDSWSLTERPGFLRLRVGFPSIDNPNPRNVVVQRPASAYYIVETCMDFTPRAMRQQAGLLVQELQTGCGIAIGFDQTNRKWLRCWQNDGDGTREAGGVRYDPERVLLKIEVDGAVFRAFYRGAQTPWTQLGPGYHYRYRSGYFTAFHPGLFAGETIDNRSAAYADFDYFRFTDLEDRPPGP